MTEYYVNTRSTCAEFNETLDKNLVKDNWINTNLNTPRCIAFDGNFLYITNSEGNNIVKSTGVYVHFKPSPSEIVVWAAQSASGATIGVPSLNKPWGIAIDGQDMYITNSGNNTITKIANFRDSTTRTSSVLPNIPLNGPREITIKGNDMYIANFNGNSITKISNFRSPPVTLSTSIDFVKGWQGNHENPGGRVSSSEDCRQQALNSNGRYVAWGYRKPNHPDPNWANTCFLYTQGFGPFNGNPEDNIHETGCLRQGELVSLGCNFPDGAIGSTMTFTNSNLLNGPYSILFDGEIMYVSCANGKNIIKIENNVASVFVSFTDSNYGMILKDDNFYVITVNIVTKINKNTTDMSRYIGTLSGTSITANLSSPIGLFIFNEDIYITNSGNNTITKILKFEYV